MELGDNSAQRFFQRVIKDLVQKHGLKENKAIKFAIKSSFFEMLKEDPDYVFHYHPTYWADIVASESEVLQYT